MVVAFGLDSTKRSLDTADTMVQEREAVLPYQDAIEPDAERETLDRRRQALHE